MAKLADKTALITGGTSGIGLATAQLFQEEGARVAVTGRSLEGLEKARETLGQDALVLASDAGCVADIETLIGRIGQHFGKLDVLVVNAGIGRAAPLEQVTEKDFDEQIATNVKGVFFTVQKALPLFAAGASVIVTTSIGNNFGIPNFGIYAASKAAARSLVQSLALELIGRGIRVNAVSPGPIDTPMYGRGGLPEEILKRKKEAIAERSPTKRFGSADEVAKVILFLANEESSYVVGEEIVVDGGMKLLRPYGQS